MIEAETIPMQSLSLCLVSAAPRNLFPTWRSSALTLLRLASTEERQEPNEGYRLRLTQQQVHFVAMVRNEMGELEQEGVVQVCLRALPPAPLQPPEALSRAAAPVTRTSSLPSPALPFDPRSCCLVFAAGRECATRLHADGSGDQRNVGPVLGAGWQAVCGVAGVRK